MNNKFIEITLKLNPAFGGEFIRVKYFKDKETVKEVIQLNSEIVKYSMTLNADPEYFNKSLDMTLKLNSAKLLAVKMWE